MTKMFIANCTQQVQDFHYRLPENQKTLKQAIGIGQQIQIPGDLSTPDVEAVIQQHSRYGMVSTSEIDRTKAFIGVCYSLDRPVDMERVRRALHHNFEVLTIKGKEIREEAAVASNNAIEEQHPDFRALEVEIVEEAKKGKDIEVNETVRVTRTEEPSTSKGKPSKADRARARRAR